MREEDISGFQEAAETATEQMKASSEQAERFNGPANLAGVNDALKTFADQAGRLNSPANLAGVNDALKTFADQAGRLNSPANLAGVNDALKTFADQAGRLNSPANLAGVNDAFRILSEQTGGFSDLVKNSNVGPVLEALRLHSGNLTAARALGYRPLKKAVAEPSFVYSKEMTSHASYFEQWEMELDSFDELLGAVTRLCRLHPDFTFLWRGQADANWALHSSLFRALWEAKGVRSPSQSHRTSEPFPTEEDMIRAETEILATVREDWRFEDLGALSTFARLQHFGAPTRLLDVSRNPLIAAWFATAQDEETEDLDCRLFALATGTLPSDDLQRSRQRTSSRVDSSDAASSVPFWHTLQDDQVRSEDEWGTGRVRRFWIPPLYESRISAQNAGFILDGVPLASPDLDQHFHQKGTGKPWTYGDRLASTSITTRFSRPNQSVGNRIASALPPSFTFRISARAKQDIRKVLNDHFSYNYASIYPDIQGAAMAMGGRLKEIFSMR
ncbi:FRG domain-containing protein [Paenarthrobacter nicotinovorans]|uniref:FRG domain-containing protein n=1 Tax=Paenarthrobacter nicotinovorans TaxID=29320 RepID=UPI00374A59A1